jgi:peptidoglycan/xylan/chitin deacetylase (PgdA/CDA1 family)
VIDATPQEFDEQVGILRRYFSLIGVEDVLRYMSGRPLPPNPAIITFDDGYRGCHDLALPILLKHGVKAAFFVATNYVTERRVFWWDRIAYAVKKCERDAIELSYPTRTVLDLRSPRNKVVPTLLALAKRHYDLDMQRFLDGLAEAAGVPWDDELERRHADELVMTWDHVRALRRAGMEIHSHTRTHRVLQTVPPGELAAELSGARRDLEEQLNEPIHALSYPVGRPIVQSPLIRAAVQAAGYRLGFSNGSGVCWLWGDLDPLDLARVSVDCHLPRSYFRALLALPSFARQ